MAKKPHPKEKKGLSASGLLGRVGKIFQKTPLPERSNRGRKRKISRHDYLREHDEIT